MAAGPKPHFKMGFLSIKQDFDSKKERERERERISSSSQGFELMFVSDIVSLSFLRTGIDFWLFLDIIISVFRTFSPSVSVISENDLANRAMKTH